MPNAGAAPRARDANGRAASWLAWATHGLTRGIEFGAATLVAIEILVLLTGVLSRYVLHEPLVWVDELAAALLIWLGTLGSLIALARSRHMRMAALVNSGGPMALRFAEALASLAMLLFMAALIVPGYRYADAESFVTLPALEISSAWRSAALPATFALGLLIAFERLFRLSDWIGILLAAGVLAGVGLLLWALTPVLQGYGYLNLAVFFILGVGALVFAGIPIAFAFGLACIAYLGFSTRVPLEVVVGRMDEGMSHLVLLAIPLFVFLGYLIEMTGLARAMVHFLASLLGHLRGGLSFVLVGAMYLVSGISGSKAADMAAVAPALFPEMRRRGADPGELVALLAATGAQTETIPPSLVLITVGSVTGVSIAALFAGGLIPALIGSLILCLFVWRRTHGEDLSHVRRASRAEIGRAFLAAVPALLLPFVIRAAVVEGVATATEVSVIAIVYAVAAGLFVYRQFDWRRLAPMLVDTACLSGSILIIIGTASAMAWALTQSGFSTDLAKLIASLPGGAAGFMAVSILAFVILGSVLEGIPAIVLFGPLLFPIARSLGINEVHYAIVAILAMGIGLFAPPFGVGYYTACAIAQVEPDQGMRPMVRYLAPLLLGIALVAAVPWLSTGFIR